MRSSRSRAASRRARPGGERPPAGSARYSRRERRRFRRTRRCGSARAVDLWRRGIRLHWGRPCRVHSPLEPARCLIGTAARSRSRAYSKGHRFRPRSPGQCVSRPTRAQPVFFWPESAFMFRCRDQGASSQTRLRLQFFHLSSGALGSTANVRDRQATTRMVVA
jgi:hypothetical protein